MKEQMRAEITVPPEDYLDYFDPEEDDYELLDMLYEDTGWYWFQFLQDIEDREENLETVAASTRDWQAMREALNALFVGNKKRRKPQTYHNFEFNHAWQDVTHNYDTSDDDFDWENFNAGGTGIDETIVSARGEHPTRAFKKKIDERDTRSFRMYKDL